MIIANPNIQARIGELRARAESLRPHVLDGVLKGDIGGLGLGDGILLGARGTRGGGSVVGLVQQRALQVRQRFLGGAAQQPKRHAIFGTTQMTPGPGTTIEGLPPGDSPFSDSLSGIHRKFG